MSGPNPSAFGGTASSVTGAGPVTLTGAYSATPALSVTDTTAAPAVPPSQLTAAAATDSMFGIQVTADTNERYTVRADGQTQWGSGAAAPDVRIARGGAGHQLQIQVADLDISTAGRGLQVSEGANGKQGTATLAAGTVVVSNTSVTATSRIFVTLVTLGTVTVPSAYGVSARVAGTSFTILASQPTDTSVVAYELIEPG